MLYIAEIMRKNFENTGRHEMVLPIVVYQGTEKFEKKPFHTYFEDLENEFLRFIPSFDFLLVEIQKIPDSDILNLGDDDALKAVMLTLKNSRRKRFLRKYFREFFSFSYQNPIWEFFSGQILLYLFEVSGLKNSEIDSLIKSQNNIQFLMRGKTAAQELREMGEKKGKLETQNEVVRTAWKKIYSANIASELTGLSLKVVQKLYIQFETEKNQIKETR